MVIANQRKVTWKRALGSLLLIAASTLPASHLIADTNTWTSLSWHDVRADVVEDVDPDQFAVDVARLAEQFDWLAENGWTPVSIDQIIDAHEGRAALPEKAVLLTFDDGLSSMYTDVFPLLKAYNYPAVAAVVTSWMEQPEDWSILYEVGLRTRDGFVSWDQVREMADSGLVAIASHSHDMHHGILSNPQGNEQPAATTREYLPGLGRYENESEWRQRVQNDLKTSADFIERRTGFRPKAIVWPYGEYNDSTEAIARELGMVVSLGLTTGPNSIDRLSRLNRFLITDNPDIGFFANALPQPMSRSIHRVVHVDLDYVYDPDPIQQERNLDVLVDRIYRLNVNTVFLQAYADPDGDGNASELYFPNRHLPMRADLFNRVSWQLRTRANVKVFAWMPVLSFDLPDQDKARRLMVKRHGVESPVTDADYRRLSPFLPEARHIISEIYTDLATHSYFDGILYHDDAYLAADEDFSACESLATWPNGEAITGCQLEPAEKTAALIDFTHELTEIVKTWHPAVLTARNMYARPILEPDSEARFSQNLQSFIDAYDITAIMAMPWMEGAEDPDAWLMDLVHAVRQYPNGLERSLFEFQSYDWAGQQWIDESILESHASALIGQGALNLGYYPDDFLNNRPNSESMFQGISIRTFPYRGYQR